MVTNLKPMNQNTQKILRKGTSVVIEAVGRSRIIG